jgi:SAM-dependent methyltransferase
MPACLVCGGALSLWCRRMERDVYRCPSCRHIAVPGGLMRDSGGASIYESTSSIFDADGNRDYYHDETNADAARAKLEYVSRFCPPGRRLLDVGASFGHFLAQARGKYDASGIEVSASAVAWARSAFDVDISVGSVYDVSRGADRFDAITCWDVIEHLEDPAGAIDRMRQALVPGGLLFLSTPDAGALVARVMGARWHYLDPIQHLHLFSRRNLVRFVTGRGFTFVDSKHFGRGYRLRYVINRLRYLAGAHGTVATTAGSSMLLNLTIPIKLWDVAGFVFAAAA